MIRVLAGIFAAALATALIFGPGRALLGGSSLRTDLSTAPSGPSANVHAGHEQAAASPAPVVPTAAKPGPNAARVAFTAAPAAKLEKGYALTVRLTSVDGKPVNETDVDFYEVVELFGQREMSIGDATTDGQGNASMLYLPAQLGPRQIVARSATHGQVTWGEARITLDAQVAAPSYRVEPPPLAAFSAILPYGVGVVVLSVWALLAFALVATARGVLGGARDHAQRKGDPA